MYAALGVKVTDRIMLPPMPSMLIFRQWFGSADARFRAPILDCEKVRQLSGVPLHESATHRHTHTRRLPTHVLEGDCVLQANKKTYSRMLRQLHKVTFGDGDDHTTQPIPITLTAMAQWQRRRDAKEEKRNKEQERERERKTKTKIETTT